MQAEVQKKPEGGIEMQDIREVARRNFEVWVETLRTKDSRKEAELYTRDSTFLPTLSSELKKGQEGAQEYFEHFLLKNPEGRLVNE